MNAETSISNIANIERLHALMDRDGLSAVVLRSGTNFTYLAGFDYAGTLARHLDFSDSPRGVLIVWPRSGTPVLVLNRFAVDRARRDSWIEDIVVFDDYGESIYERAAKVLHDLGLAGERIGFEKTVVSAADWAVLESVLPAAEIADCARMMEEVRWIKTRGERSNGSARRPGSSTRCISTCFRPCAPARGSATSTAASSRAASSGARTGRTEY